jgi:hypothetical protein
VKYNVSRTFFYFFFWFLSHAPRPNGSLNSHAFDDSNDCCKEVPFGSYVDIARHFGGEMPHNPSSLTSKGEFKAKSKFLNSFLTVRDGQKVSTEYLYKLEVTDSNYLTIFYLWRSLAAKTAAGLI